MREEKASWRRGSPATAVTAAQLGEILAAAGLHDSVRSVELLSGGLVNTNYRWDLGNLLRYERASRPRFEPHASQGYIEGGGELPDGWNLLARSLDLVSLCEMLGRNGIPPEMAAELTGCIEYTLSGS